MTSEKKPAKHASGNGIPTAVRLVATGVVLGLVAFGIGALMNLESPTVPTVPSVPSAAPGAAAVTTAAAAVTTATVAATSTPGASAVAAASGHASAAAPMTDQAYSEPVADMGALLPASVAGYTSGVVETSTASAILSLQPTKDGPMGKASLVVLTALDKGSAAAAKEYVTSVDRAYPKDLAAVTIGSASGWFGTDGAHLAAATFARGRFAFEVVATVPRGAPVDLKAVVLQAADSFAAAH